MKEFRAELAAQPVEELRTRAAEKGLENTDGMSKKSLMEALEIRWGQENL